MNQATTQTSREVVRKKAVIFVRVVAVEYEPSFTQAIAAGQRNYCLELASKLGADVVETFTAIGETTDLVVAEAIGRALQMVEAEGIDYFIASGSERLTRRRPELIRIENHLEAAGARLITASWMR